MDRPFERVYTIHDVWDGARSGFADLDGAPHVYQSIFRHDLDEWDPDGRFELSPIAPITLSSVLEDWSIWRRWEEAFYAGHTSQDTHPALPEDRARHEELKPIVERALTIDQSQRRVAKGLFRARDPIEPGVRRPRGRIALEVCWEPAEFDAPAV
jgi:hypothetical protein